MPRLVCPGCGTAVQLEGVARTAAEFCPTPGCDYPLFWGRATTGEVLDDMEPPAGDAVRRRPGTSGRVVLSHRPCPACREPNLLSAVFCHRCGADLRPALPDPEPAPPVRADPPPAPAPSLPPTPPPPPRRSSWLDWRAVAVLVVLLVTLMLTGSLVLLSRA